MHAGKLRHRVVIQKANDGAAVFNGSKTWVTYATVWAEIKPARGTEYVDAGTNKTESDITHTIKMRYIRGITPDMRISYGGRIFKIEVPRDIDERNREIIIQAKEETD